MLSTTALASRVQIPEIEGAFYIHRSLHEDDRGNFAELFRASDYEKTFVQQNQSLNFLGTLRGMHFQREKPQGKLVTCVYGTILDIMFDLRPDSKTFMRGTVVELNNRELPGVYVPEGVAHGFLTTSRFAVVHYNCTNYYEKELEAGVNWRSRQILELLPEEIGFPTVSRKDALLPTVDEYLAQIK